MPDSEAVQPQEKPLLDLAPKYREQQTMRQLIWHSYRRHKPAMIGTAIVLIFALAAIFAPYISPWDPEKTNLDAMLQQP